MGVRGWRWPGRFATFVLGALAASLVWLLVMTATTTTPGESREQRAAPDLAAPTVPIERVQLRQVVTGPCVRDGEPVPVIVPKPPSGSRSVVTSLARGGSRVRTGTVVAMVAGRPLVAVVTDTVLYRDLQVGDRGPDVRGLERAFAKAGLIGAGDDVMDAGTLAAWARIDPTAGSRIPLDRLVAVPAATKVAGVSASVGDVVKPGSTLMSLDASSGRFTCDLPPPSEDFTPDQVSLTIDQKTVPVDAVRPLDSGDGSPPTAIQVTPRGERSGDEGEVSVEVTATKGKVLAVPLAALKTTVEGKTAVVVAEGSKHREVPVEVGVTAQGMIEVTGKGLEASLNVVVFGPEGSEQIPQPGAGE